MPYFTFPIAANGPIIIAFIGVSQSRYGALVAAGQTPPPPIQINALLDTGASHTCVEPSILTALALVSHGTASVLTASTGSTPQSADQYDVSLFIPGSSPAHPPYSRNTLAVLSAVPNSLNPQGFQALIGRDVLAHCIFFYNGPTGTCTVAY